MAYRGFVGLSWIYVMLNLVGIGRCGDVYYVIEFTDQVMSCPDFTNEIFKTEQISVGLIPASDDDDGGLGLNGPLEVCSEVDEMQDLSMNIVKETEVGRDPVMSARGNICSSMDDEDTPWHPVLKMMNITSCPIATGSYAMKNLKLEMGSLEPFMNRDMCGEYEIELKIEKELDTLSCHILRVEIMEKQTED